VQQAQAQVTQFSSALVRELLRLALSARSEPVRLGAVSKRLDPAFRAIGIEDIAARLTALEEANAQKL